MNLLISGYVYGQSVLLHEIAWMGTTQSPDDRWVELYNATDAYVSLDGWKLTSRSGGLATHLTGRLAPGQTLFVASTGDRFLGGIPVNQSLKGTWPQDGDALMLLDASGMIVDQVDQWYAGNAETGATMQRTHPYREGSRTESWKTSTVRYDHGFGTPGFRNPPDSSGQALYHVYHDNGTLNVFFNQDALTQLAFEDNEANNRINLEERIIDRIRQARHRIDIALYDMNLPDVAEALIERAAEGVEVRLLVDAKTPSDADRDVRYRIMRIYIEQMMRGRDGRIGSKDSVQVFANSPIFAVTDPQLRAQHGLPRQLRGNIPEVTLQIGRSEFTGHLLVKGAEREPGVYYAPGGQMHNKFVIIDDYRVLTGSMNFTETGIYGSYQNRLARRPDGNSNNLIDLHSRDVARVFREEFDQMWGSNTHRPDSSKARFRSQKEQGRSPHRFVMNDMNLQVLFSPGYDVIPFITDFVETEAQSSVYFCIFAFSDSALESTLKRKWEGTALDNEGERTGFQVKGVFERIFWNQWWSANMNMEGRTAPRVSELNPNIRWRNRPPVYRDRENRKLHHKYMLVDADTPHNPTVITGSANWSRNANEVNDENTLFIHDAHIANQFLQEFCARYQQAGGSISEFPDMNRLAQRP